MAQGQSGLSFAIPHRDQRCLEKESAPRCHLAVPLGSPVEYSPQFSIDWLVFKVDSGDARSWAWESSRPVLTFHPEPTP